MMSSSGRLRSVLFEGSVIFLIGVTMALIVVGGMRLFSGPSLEDFKREYAIGDVWNQKAVAEKYMTLFPVADLLRSIEEQNAAGNCHSQGHGIGRALYDANPNFTAVTKQCGGTCTQGCFHGAMMEMFATDSDTLGGVIEDDSPEATLRHIQTVALDLCTRPEVESVVQPRYCTHGLGHVFAYFSPDEIDAAITSCELLDTKYAADSCASGAFMEYLFSASSTVEYLEKGAGICAAYPAHTQACFQFKSYGWIHAWGGVRPAIQACDSFGADTMMCIFTVAQAGANLHLLETEEGFDSLCGGLTGEKHTTCINGALFKIIDLNNGDESERLCDGVASDYREPCITELREYRAKVMYDK